MVPEPVMNSPFIRRPGYALAALALAASASLPIYAAEHVTLRNGEELDCSRQEPAGDHVRLYLMPSGNANYIEISANSVLRIETVPDPPPPAAATSPNPRPAGSLQSATPTPAEMNQMLANAGALHNIDADLLASVVQAESNG